MKIDINTFTTIRAKIANGNHDRTWVTLFAPSEDDLTFTVFGSRDYCEALQDAINSVDDIYGRGSPAEPPSTKTIVGDDDIPF